LSIQGAGGRAAPAPSITAKLLKNDENPEAPGSAKFYAAMQNNLFDPIDFP
jgi:hypothetical protein